MSGRLFARLLAASGVLAVAAALATSAARAQQPAVDCKALARQIAQIERRPDRSAAQKYERAAAKQRSEIERTQNYGEQSGCWTQSFYDAPKQLCRQLDDRLAKMRANLDELEFRAEDALSQRSRDGDREAAIADYEAFCSGQDGGRDVAAPARRLPLDVVPPDEPSPDAGYPADIAPDGHAYPPDIAVTAPPSASPSGADLGDAAICVRSCDGGYFPLTAPVRATRVQDLQELCAAQCPNVEAKLYTMRKGQDVANATTPDGDLYSAHPNAFRFRKKYDPACACKPAGKNWGQVLTEAEKLLEKEIGKQDAQVTPQQAEKLSQPIVAPPAQPSAPRASKPEATKADAGKISGAKAAPPAAPAPVTPLASGPAPTADPAGDYREVIGPDGVKRRVRIVGPKP